MTFDWTSKSDARRPAGVRPRLVVVHTAEGARTKESLSAYFQRDDVAASSHAGTDDSGCLEMVPYDRAAWTIRRANSISDNMELCGFAAWSRDEWLQHDGMLTHAALWVRDRCLARGIPIKKISPEQIVAGESGVCGHVDWTMATRLQGNQDGSHTDPGQNFPWDVVMARANGMEDELDQNQANQLDAIYRAVMVPGQPYGFPQANNDRLAAIQDAVTDTHTRVRGESPIGDMLQLIYAAVIGMDAGQVDVDALAAKLKDGLGDEVAKSLGERLAR